MHGFLLARRFGAIVLAVVLAASAGCPSAAEKPAAERKQSESKQPTTEQTRSSELKLPTTEQTQPSKSKQSTADDSVAMSKPPAAEFQEPPALPPNEPPPKLAAEPVDEPAPRDTPIAPAYNRAVSIDELPRPSEEKTTPPEKSPPKLRTGKHSGKPFDPVKENGPIFEGWPKPKAAIAITGMERGYIEPCGCAGLDRMKGGMGRRYTLFQQLRKNGWPLVAFDVGNIAHGFGRQAEMKFNTLVESKVKMGYNAVAFGADDLRLPAAELVSVAADVNDKPSMFLSANVGLFGLDKNITQTSRVVEAGGMKIGVTAILGKQYQKEINNPEKGISNPEIETIDPETALKKVVPELKRKANYLVLLANATKAEAIELAKKFPEFNAVVVSEGGEVPPDRPETIEGTQTLLISVGNKGSHVVVLGLFDDAKQPFRYQRVPLDSRFTASPEMKQLMATYQENLKLLGLAELGLRPVPHPLAEENGRFVASKKCEACHEKSYDIWKKSKHRHAYETLAKLDPPRDNDPECISCHVIGWHPTKFFPYESGFKSLEKTPHLTDTGCDDCHGPGEKHVTAELGSNEELQKKYRKAVRVTKEQSKKEQCMTCHDLDNNPDFDFDAYWPLIEHREKEDAGNGNK